MLAPVTVELVIPPERPRVNASPSATLTQRTYDVAIVGNDMLLAALPARPVQVFHAVQACGFDLVVPVSWGEEVLAEQAMRRLAENGARPMVFCACPRVRARLLQSGNELVPHVLSLVAPPVAAARYLRALHPNQSLRITYLGTCEGAADPAISVRIAPTDFLRSLHQRGIIVTQQPTIFESIVPPDRRRFWSQPGGLPTRQAMQDRPLTHQLSVLADDDIAARIADHLLLAEEVLMDLAPQMGCACAGSVAVHNTVASREALAALEPPRASLPVIEGELRVDVDLPMPHLESGMAAPRPLLRLEPTGGTPPPIRRAPATKSTPVPAEVPLESRRIGGTASGRVVAPRPRVAVTPPGVSQQPSSEEGAHEAPRPPATPPVELRRLSSAPRPPVRTSEPPPPAVDAAPPHVSPKRVSPAFGMRHVARAGRPEGQLPRAAYSVLRGHRAAGPATIPEAPAPPPPTPTPLPAGVEPAPPQVEGIWRPPEPPQSVEALETQPAIEAVVTPPAGIATVPDTHGGSLTRRRAARERSRPAGPPAGGGSAQRPKLWGLLASIIAIVALTIVLKVVLDL